MKANRVCGFIASLAMSAVSAIALAQSGPPQQGDQNGPPPPGMQGPGGQGMGGPGMGMGRRMGPPPPPPLFFRPDVQKELKLSDDQIQKLCDLAPGGGQGGPQGPGQTRGGFGSRRMDGQQGGMQMGGRPGRMGPDPMNDQVKDILTDSQMKRLKELQLQREGGMALMRKDVAEQVGLSDNDRYRIRGMVDEAMQSMRPDGQQQQRPDRKAMEQMRSKLSDQILSSLSAKQKAKFDELCGKPFKFDESWEPPRPNGRMGGGPQGGGPDGGFGGPPPGGQGGPPPQGGPGGPPDDNGGD